MKLLRILFFPLLLLPLFAFAAVDPATIITRVGVATAPIKYYFDLSSALSSGVNQGVKVTVSASNSEKTAVRFESVKLFDQSGAAVGNNVASKTDALTGIPYGFTFSNFGVAPADLANVAGVQITFMDLGGENPTGKVTVQSVAVSVTRDSGEACVIADPITIVLPPPPPPTILSIQTARPLVRPGTHGTGGSGGSSTSVGPSYPSAVSTSGSGSAAWAMPGNAMSDDGVFAQATSAGIPADTNNLDAIGFTGFSSIPSSATINGIVAEVDFSSSPGSTINDSTIYLIKAGSAISANRARTPLYTWPSSGEVVTYGTPTDIGSWGAITASDVAFSTFGLRVKGAITSIGGSGMVDFVRLTVYYTEGGASVYDSFMDLLRTLFSKIKTAQ